MQGSHFRYMTNPLDEDLNEQKAMTVWGQQQNALLDEDEDEADCDDEEYEEESEEYSEVTEETEEQEEVTLEELDRKFQKHCAKLNLKLQRRMEKNGQKVEDNWRKTE